MAGFRVALTGKPFASIDLANTKIMRELGAGLIARIRSRTERGVNVEGQTFRPLSPSYALQKQRAVGHSRANLTVSGAMLNAMIVQPRPDSCSIVFASGGSRRATGRTLIQRSRSVGAADKAFWHNMSGAGKARIVREFFGFNDSDQDWAVSVWERFIRGQL